MSCADELCFSVVSREQSSSHPRRDGVGCLQMRIGLLVEAWLV